jgi:hypothetical protein
MPSEVFKILVIEDRVANEERLELAAATVELRDLSAEAGMAA